MQPWNDISVEEETKIEDVAGRLYRRIDAEVEKILTSQLEIIGGDIGNVDKTIYPDDELALATYEYNGVNILGVRISDNRMAIHFDIPNLTTETQKEVQNDV